MECPPTPGLPLFSPDEHFSGACLERHGHCALGCVGTVSSGRDYNLSILEMREQRGREVKKLVQSRPASQRWGWGLMPVSTGQATMPKMITEVFSRWDVLRGSQGTGSHLILPSLCPHLCAPLPERRILSGQKAWAAQAPSAASQSS